MKCIRCQHDCKYPERADGKCPKCKGKFAFEPRRGDPFTDAAFQRAIVAVSSGGSTRWGVEHLYYELCRRQRAQSKNRVWTWAALAIFLVVIGFIVSANVASPAPLVLALILAGVLIAVGCLWRPWTVGLDLSRFGSWYAKWVTTHGEPEGVIVRKDSPARSTTESELEADVSDYSFDRAVICDRARTVDVLLANHFHFENNCAILSIDGYPPGPFETVRKMLKQNPRLMVYALHDATRAGCELAHRLATDADWFGGRVKVVDVGLRPVHASRFRGLLIPAETTRVAESEAITAWEANWLSKYNLELAVVRPDQLIKRLFKAINMSIKAEDYDTDVIYLASRHPHDSGASDGDGGGNGGTYVAIMSSETGDSDGAADSFG